MNDFKQIFKYLLCLNNLPKSNISNYIIVNILLLHNIMFSSCPVIQNCILSIICIFYFQLGYIQYQWIRQIK